MFKESVPWTGLETIIQKTNSTTELTLSIKINFQKDLSFKEKEELLVDKLNNKTTTPIFTLKPSRKRSL